MIFPIGRSGIVVPMVAPLPGTLLCRCFFHFRLQLHSVHFSTGGWVRTTIRATQDQQLFIGFQESAHECKYFIPRHVIFGPLHFLHMSINF